MNKMNKINKKGQILVMIIELLVVAIVIFTTIRVATDYGNSIFTKKVSLAEDIRMMTNTLVGVPGDAVVQYPEDVSEFNVILRADSVTVFKDGDTSAERVVRKFYLPEGYDAFGTLKDEAKLCMKKKDKKIILRRCEEKTGQQPEVASPPAGTSTFFGLEVKENPVVFVIDHSGSMKDKSEWQFPSGVIPPGDLKIDVAKWQLKSALQRMEDGRKFNIVFFDSKVDVFKSGLVELNTQTRQEAESFIDSFEPGTGTNTGEAVKEALNLGDIEAIYLLSDGQPDVAQVALAEIRNANAAKKVKINAVGIFNKVPETAGPSQKELLDRARQEGEDFMKQVTDESGGRLVIQQ